MAATTRRLHLALIGADLLPLYAEQAKARMSAGQERGRQSQKGTVQESAQTQKGKARDAAAKARMSAGKKSDPKQEVAGGKAQGQARDAGHAWAFDQRPAQQQGGRAQPCPIPRAESARSACGKRGTS